jgi:hypothetical protein
MKLNVNQCTGVLLLLFCLHAQAESAKSKGIMDAVGDLYSNAELKMQLATAHDTLQCVGEGCDEYQEFETKVQSFGALLAERAYLQFPDLKREVPEFAFTVAEKAELALASNKLGHVVVFRGIQGLQLSDEALKFLIAREMAHVIAKHHDKNISTKLLISALTAVAFPAVTFLAASQAAAEMSTVTTVVSSAASTATSLVGSKVAVAKLKPRQLVEADKLALQLMQEETLDMIGLSSELKQPDTESTSAWEQDLMKTQAFLTQLSEAQAEQLATEMQDQPASLSAEASPDRPIDNALETSDFPMQ